MLKDRSVDLVVTSPPYNVGRGGYIDNRLYDEYIEWLEKIFGMLYPKLCPGGRLCINIGEGKNGRLPMTAHLTQCLEKTGYLPYGRIVWDKQQISNRTTWGSWLSPSSPSFPAPVEYILIFCKESYKLLKDGISDLIKEEFVSWAYGIWRFPAESRMRQKYNHDAVFPEELPRRCIKMLSWVGALVVDPFSGTGTTAVVACELGRDFICFEEVAEHYKTSLNRLENRKKRLKMKLFN